MLSAELLDRGHSMHAGHLEVQEDRIEVGVKSRRLQPFLAVAGLEDDVERTRLPQQSCQARSQDGVVVDDQELHRQQYRASQGRPASRS